MCFIVAVAFDHNLREDEIIQFENFYCAKMLDGSIFVEGLEEKTVVGRKLNLQERREFFLDNYPLEFVSRGNPSCYYSIGKKSIYLAVLCKDINQAYFKEHRVDFTCALIEQLANIFHSEILIIFCEKAYPAGWVLEYISEGLGIADILNLFRDEYDLPTSIDAASALYSLNDCLRDWYMFKKPT